MKKVDEIKFSFKDMGSKLNELKNRLDNHNNMTLEINLLSEENRVTFAKLHNELQNNYPDKFPLTIKLNEKMKDNVVIYFD